ncbi:hypothetical protein ABLV49_07425 [Polaromonas hydrogenivorans]|uniref:Transposase n=1 Tax=Polaromonas hydrogenivorans TaxID=335476 RepID=A0AAU7LVJ8_9BURK
MATLLIKTANGKIVCPRCGELAPRVKRRLIDRVISLFKPVKRYRCEFCDWKQSVTSHSAPRP